MTTATSNEHEPPASSAAPRQDSRQAAMGKRVGAGMIFMVMSVLASRGVALVAQGVLAFLLTKSDFGIYAIAMAAASLIQIFRDGGLRFVLIHRGPSEYERISGPVFWMSMAFNVATALLLAASAPVVAAIYDDRRLAVMLLLIASTAPFTTVQMMCDTRLRLDLRFKVIASLAFWSAMIRYSVTILAAWLGAGPLSMVYALMVVTVFETAGLYAFARDRSWSRPPNMPMWSSLFAQGKWAIAQLLAVSLIYYGMYGSMGLFVSKEVVGVYSFAFAILTQSGQVLAAQFESVLLPSIARLQHDPDRRRRAVIRALHAMTISCIPLSLFVGIIYGPVEALIWRGRWESTVPCVWIMAGTYPLFVLHVLPRAVLMGSGRFRYTAMFMLAVGAGMTISAGVSAWVGGTALWITAGTGVFSVIAGVWMIVRGLAFESISAREVLASLAPAATLLTAVSAAVVAADVYWLVGLHPAVRCVIVAGAGGFLLAALLRTAFVGSLKDLLELAPDRLSAPLRRVLALPRPEPGGARGAATY
ncbi:MAG: oligosaccharide flippase family protein [Phycisphaeraceae bacterium]|nr:oligosaccharide flippase family protein [Phycisphaeraceae bacterium]